jgi:S1-C subfamily serine protease
MTADARLAPDGLVRVDCPPDTRVASSRSGKVAALIVRSVAAVVLAVGIGVVLPPMEVAQAQVPKKAPSAKKPKKEPKGPEGKLKDVLARVKKSTALVEGKGGAGSAFVIRPGILITNAHVIDGNLLDDLKVRFVSLEETDPKPYKPVLLYKDRRRDLAILRIEGSQSPLTFCGPGTELEGMKVAVVGNPVQPGGALKIGEVTFGALRAPARLDDGQIFYQLDAVAAPGNSGGPVISEKSGEVVGVLTAGLRGMATTYCIPFGEVNKALNRLPPTDKEADAVKVATARHYLDFISSKLPVIEGNAAIAMKLQLLNLKYGRENVSITIDGKVFQLGEVMAELKDEHMKTSQMLSRLHEKHIRHSAEFPDALRRAVTIRIESCAGMQGVATTRTEREVTFVKIMDDKKTASDRSVKTFETEFKKYQDALEKKYADGGK